MDDDDNSTILQTHLPPGSQSCSPGCGYTGLPCYKCSTKNNCSHHRKRFLDLSSLDLAQLQELLNLSQQRHIQRSHSSNVLDDLSDSDEFMTLCNSFSNNARLSLRLGDRRSSVSLNSLDQDINFYNHNDGSSDNEEIAGSFASITDSLDLYRSKLQSTNTYTNMNCSVYPSNTIREQPSNASSNDSSYCEHQSTNKFSSKKLLKLLRKAVKKL